MSDNKALVGLQFLRGFCALAVVADHTAGMVALPKYFGAPILGGALEHGLFGVDIFFVISAFIISIVVLRGDALKPALSPAAFFRKRFARIVPLMWIAILSYALLQAVFAHADIDGWAYIRALLLVPYSYVKPDMIWTLRHEFLFYTIFCLSFFGVRILRLVILAWVLAPIGYVAFLGGVSATTAYVDTTPAILFNTVNLEFGAGLIVGILWVRRTPRADLRLPVHPFWLIGLLTLCVIAVAAALPFTFQSLPVTATLAVLGACLVALAARAACPPGRLTALGTLLGDASYAIYLFHLHVIASLLAIWTKLLPHSPAMLVVLIVIGIATAAGILVHLVLERPLVRWTQRFLAPPPTAPVAGVPR